jgi:preprotein translocase subunit SecF
MKRIINFTKGAPIAIALSLLAIAGGVVSYAMNGGFNLGVDFQAGLLQEVQFAPRSFSLTYTGKGIVQASLERDRLDIVISGSDVDKTTVPFYFTSYPTVAELASGLNGVDGLAVIDVAAPDASSAWLVQSASQNPRLSSTPSDLHYLAPGAEPISIDDVRAALVSVEGSSVQMLGDPSERKFMLRVQDQAQVDGFALSASESLTTALKQAFGPGAVAVNRSDYVGSRFSKGLTDQVFMLVSLTLLLILIYSAIRFKPRFAFGAVFAIIHDALIMIGFIAITRMEFNTTTIAAILTILGYSINDTIVIFDRIRESVRLYPDDKFVVNVNRAISETLGRTVITTVTTLLAVTSLFIFTTGSMKDFALALIVGMLSGVYSTIYIACGFLSLWDKYSAKKASKKLVKAAAKS